jgi:hypothetical protein
LRNGSPPDLVTALATFTRSPASEVHFTEPIGLSLQSKLSRGQYNISSRSGALS